MEDIELMRRNLRMKRRNLILALGILLSLSGVTPVYAADTEPAIVENQKSVQNGWVLYKWKEMEYWHYYIDGEMVKSQRITIDGKDYYFDGSGVMTTGMIWYMEPNGETKCIYAAEDGHIVKDRNKWFTQKRFGKESWYYFKDDSFIACDEFVTIFGKVYHFDDQARMSVGSFKVFDEQLGEYGAYVSYTADANGVVSGYPKTGWVRAGGNWYYYITEDVIAKMNFAPFTEKSITLMSSDKCRVENSVYMIRKQIHIRII